MSADLGLVQLGEIVAERYRIEAPLGEGGFGSVFRAAHLSTGQRVALKVLHAHLTDGGSRHRFEREARLARQLTHPNTVRLLDFGETERGLPFIAFELLQGESLGALLRRQGAAPPARVAHIASQVLKSLMEAHALGIVHRDIKPANLFLCSYSGSPDFVKVLDFGIAKSDSPYTRALTREDEIIGTPAYMAPEHIAGRPLTGSADLYALGLVMAELLGGARIYRGNGIAICMEQLSEQPVPLPPSALASPLGVVVHRATQKNPAHRYMTAADMLRDVDQAAGALRAFVPADPSQLLTMQRSLSAQPRAPLATRPGSPFAPSSAPVAPINAWAPAVRAAPDSAKRGRLGRVLALLASALVLLVAGGAGVIAYQRYASAAAVALATKAAPKAGQAIPSVAPAALEALDKKVIVERAERAGYSVVSASDGLHLVMVTVTNPRETGYVTLYESSAPRAVQSACAPDPTAPSVIGGSRCLRVKLGAHATRKPDPAAARALLNALVQGP